MKQEFDEIQFLNRTTFDVIPDAPSDSFLPNDTTPDVSNQQGVMRGSGTVVTITNFNGGSDSQMLIIKGDGTTTIDHNANIKTNTGAPKLLSADRIYLFFYLNAENCWYEH